MLRSDPAQRQNEGDLALRGEVSRHHLNTDHRSISVLMIACTWHGRQRQARCSHVSPFNPQGSTLFCSALWPLFPIIEEPGHELKWFHNLVTQNIKLRVFTYLDFQLLKIRFLILGCLLTMSENIENPGLWVLWAENLGICYPLSLGWPTPWKQSA